MKDKKGINIDNEFQGILDSSKRKPNKILVDQDSEFYRKWLKESHIEMYWTHKAGRSVVAERFVRSLKNKIYKRMRFVSKKSLLRCFKWYCW